MLKCQVPALGVDALGPRKTNHLIFCLCDVSWQILKLDQTKWNKTLSAHNNRDFIPEI